MPDPSGRPVQLERAALKTPRAAGIAGIIFAVLFAASLTAARPPRTLSTGALADWYAGDALSTLVLIGLYGIPFAGIAFLWFMGVVRDRIGESEDRFFATVFLGSGLLFVAMMFVSAACATALSLGGGVEAVTAAGPEVLRFAHALTYAFLYVYAARAAGVFMLATSTIVLRTEALPRWVAILGYAIALMLLLSIRYFQLIILLFPAWVAVLSIAILVTMVPHGRGKHRSEPSATGGA